MSLILTRKLDETIVISDNISVTINKIRGNSVSIKIDAPKETSVHRKEIYQRISESMTGG